ncbi:gamma-glutamyl-gamma-aminobutyrate hydrolase family protein [Poriferisphaera sp. WC338]|uniref:gamma-glutamyl-gamma-aminobutyrate hydrolase family protein n=1 Tax=Poriferisphaera sp. WC338 TaxID=3425129 RepID=UPI003D818E3D
MSVIIGITVDTKDNTWDSGKYQSGLGYSNYVAEAGGIPILLPQRIELVKEFVNLCDAIVFTGGDDLHMDKFGHEQHPQSNLLCPNRQAFETALYAEIHKRPEYPVLAICLGMQLMALLHGGEINQCLPETLDSHEKHMNDLKHPVELVVDDSVMDDVTGDTTSYHRQAIADPGDLRIVARDEDGTIEAIDDPSKPFYLGVQWHPERSARDAVGLGLFKKVVEAAKVYQRGKNG